LFNTWRRTFENIDIYFGMDLDANRADTFLHYLQSVPLLYPDFHRGYIEVVGKAEGNHPKYQKLGFPVGL